MPETLPVFREKGLYFNKDIALKAERQEKVGSSITILCKFGICSCEDKYMPYVLKFLDEHNIPYLKNKRGLIWVPSKPPALQESLLRD